MWIKQIRGIKFYKNFVKAIRSYNSGEVDVSHYPIIGYLEPSTICNLECPSCPTGLKQPIRERALLSYEKFKSILDEWGPYLVTLYMYNWGEPFLNKDFIKMVKYATCKGIRVYGSTNFNVKLSMEMAEELADSGLTSLKIGVDGITQKTYSQYRRKGSLNLVVENIKLLVSAKKKKKTKTPALNAVFHVFEHNETEIEEARDFLLDIGVDRVSFAPGFLPNSKKHDINPPGNEKYNISKQYGKRIQANNTMCTWLWFTMVINPNSSISPCCAVIFEKHDFTKLNEDNNILEAYNSKKYHLARKIKERNAEPKYDDSMGLSAGDRKLGDNEVLCQYCPTPFIINNYDPKSLTDNIVSDLFVCRPEGIKNKLKLIKILFILRNAVGASFFIEKAKLAIMKRLGYARKETQTEEGK